MDHIFFKVEILANEDREWHESFSLVLGPDDPVEAVLGDVTTATVTILDQEAAGSLILPAPPIVSCLTQRGRCFYVRVTSSDLRGAGLRGQLHSSNTVVLNREPSRPSLPRSPPWATTSRGHLPMSSDISGCHNCHTRYY